jgi:glycogen operon protein
MNDNNSWNCGIEGDSGDASIETLRIRQIKNFFTILLLSQGTPMLCMGDEVRRTQKGNNNAYCQDGPISWFDWDLMKRNAGLLDFVTKLIRFIQMNAIFQHERLLTAIDHPTQPSIVWHGIKLGKPDWGFDSHSISFLLCHPENGERIHVMLNSYWEPLTFELPPCNEGKRWRRIVDTSKTTPEDFAERAHAIVIHDPSYPVDSRSSVVLLET